MADKDHEKKAHKAETAATPAPETRPIPKARQNTVGDIPPEDLPKPTEAEIAAKKASEESAKIEAEAHKRAGQINANLAKEGSTRRIMGGVRDGKPMFFWGNFVPTQALTEEELEAVGGS